MTSLAARIGLSLLVITGIGVGVGTGVADAKSPGTAAKSLGAKVIAFPQPPPTHAEVVALVDGDSFDVRFNDQVTRVQLADVAAPVDAQTAGQAASCLAPEASAQLASMIPAGTQLTLTYDKDRFGHTTAQAVTTDGRLVNAEIVKSGLAQEVQADTRAPVPSAIDAAAQDALVNKRGLHDPSIACTVPGRVKTLTDLVATIPASPPPGADIPDLATAANSATDARMAADELDSAFTQNRQGKSWLVLDPNERTYLETQVQAAGGQAEADEAALRNATNIAVNQDATQAATQKEATRIAKSLADIRKAEADRAAEAASRLAAARKVQADAAQARADAQRKEQETHQDSRDSDKDSKEDDSSHSSSSKDDKKSSKDDDKDSGRKN